MKTIEQANLSETAESRISELRTRLYRHARKKHSPEDSEDLVQEAIAKVLNCQPRMFGKDFCVNYFLTTLDRIAIDRWRKNRFLENVNSNQLDETLCLDGEEKGAFVGVEELKQAINKLGSNERHLIELRLTGMTFREIGQQTGVTEKTASKRYNKAVCKLRSHLSLMVP